MEAIQKDSKNSLFKNFGLGGIGLCALLCALPIIGTSLGIGALATIAAYFEKIGIAILILSVGILGYWVYKKRSVNNKAAHSCDVDCDCKTQAKEQM